jgi:hypothetical protein
LIVYFISAPIRYQATRNVQLRVDATAQDDIDQDNSDRFFRSFQNDSLDFGVPPDDLCDGCQGPSVSPAPDNQAVRVFMSDISGIHFPQTIMLQSFLNFTTIMCAVMVNRANFLIRLMTAILFFLNLHCQMLYCFRNEPELSQSQS